jgi:transposase
MFIGVDTHKKTYTLVGIDDHGQTCGTRTVANSPHGWTIALRWVRDHGDMDCWGIENSGSLGKGFALFLLAHGETDVREVSPQRTAQYRRRSRSQDKTDDADALAIARLLRAEGKQLPLIQADDASTELRLLSDHRDNLVAERTRLINQLHAQMLQIDPCYAERSGALTSRTGVRYCRDLDLANADGVLQTRVLIVRQLTDQLLRLWEEIEIIESALRQGVAATGTPLLQLCGVGTIIAARLIGETGPRAAQPLRRRARCPRGDRARRGVVGRATWLSAESGR